MRRRLCSLLLLLTALPALAVQDRVPGAATAAPATERADRAIDAGWILQQLTRPPPVATPFVELRVSSMLKRPLLLSGEYRRPDADTLVRDVRTPYVETTTIRDGEATLAREGRATRTFSLSRVPELAALQGSFGALLSGDRALLERDYTLEVGGDAGHWTMTMTPKDPRSASRLTAVVLHGRGDELRCIETQPRQGDAQPTLLAGAAASAATVDTLDEALRLCRER